MEVSPIPTEWRRESEELRYIVLPGRSWRFRSPDAQKRPDAAKRIAMHLDDHLIVETFYFFLLDHSVFDEHLLTHCPRNLCIPKEIAPCISSRRKIDRVGLALNSRVTCFPDKAFKDWHDAKILSIGRKAVACHFHSKAGQMSEALMRRAIRIAHELRLSEAKRSTWFQNAHTFL